MALTQGFPLPLWENQEIAKIFLRVFWQHWPLFWFVSWQSSFSKPFISLPNRSCHRRSDALVSTFLFLWTHLVQLSFRGSWTFFPSHHKKCCISWLSTSSLSLRCLHPRFSLIGCGTLLIGLSCHLWLPKTLTWYGYHQQQTKTCRFLKSNIAVRLTISTNRLTNKLTLWVTTDFVDCQNTYLHPFQELYTQWQKPNCFMNLVVLTS